MHMRSLEESDNTLADPTENNLLEDTCSRHYVYPELLNYILNGNPNGELRQDMHLRIVVPGIRYNPQPVVWGHDRFAWVVRLSRAINGEDDDDIDDDAVEISDTVMELSENEFDGNAD